MHQAAPSYGNAFSTQGGEWIMDSGASTHVTGNQGMLTSSHSPLGLNSSHIVVGNDSRLPVAATGTAHLTTRPFYLRNVLVSPHIIQNLISTRRFSRDNSCSVEFDPFGFSLKDLATKEVLLRSNSSGDLYPFFGDRPSSTATAFSVTQDLWHKRLGHPTASALAHLPLQFLSECNNSSPTVTVCDACQLGKQTRLPFSVSHSRASSPFDLIHCDLWTSPVVSCSGYKYYLVVLDDFAHYSWIFPLRAKSETCDILL
jgi:histone deacetylase 1/2